MTAIAHALEGRADLDERHRRMSESIIELIEDPSALDAAERRAWLHFAQDLIAAVHRGDDVVPLIEEGHRQVLLARSGAVGASRRLTIRSEQAGMVILKSRGDIEDRLGG